MIRVVRINNIGLPRSGKTSFRRRMTGDILNIEVSGERVQPSTGVAEDCGQVIIRSATANLGTISSNVWSVVKDLGEEANMLNQFFFQAANSNPSATEVPQDEVPVVPKKPIAPAPGASAVPKSSASNSAKKSYSSPGKSNLLERVFSFFGITPGGKDISEMFSVIENAIEG